MPFIKICMISVECYRVGNGTCWTG